MALEDADHARGLGGRAGGRHGHEVELVGHGQVPGQVGHEDEGALEHPDQQHVAPGVVLGDLGGQIANLGLDLVLGEQHRLDVVLR